MDGRKDGKHISCSYNIPVCVLFHIPSKEKQHSSFSPQHYHLLYFICSNKIIFRKVESKTLSHETAFGKDSLKIKPFQILLSDLIFGRHISMHSSRRGSDS